VRLAAALADRPPSRPIIIRRSTAPGTTVAREPAAPLGARPASPTSTGDDNSPPAAEPAAATETSGFDEAAESAFLAEARDRGEVVKPRAESAVEAVDEIETKSLPALDDLVAKIPVEVRETLEDLFRARFTTVKRLPKKALNK
jgi:hypothetical protein